MTSLCTGCAPNDLVRGATAWIDADGRLRVLTNPSSGSFGVSAPLLSEPARTAAFVEHTASTQWGEPPGRGGSRVGATVYIRATDGAARYAADPASPTSPVITVDPGPFRGDVSLVAPST